MKLEVGALTVYNDGQVVGRAARAFLECRRTKIRPVFDVEGRPVCGVCHASGHVETGSDHLTPRLGRIWRFRCLRGHYFTERAG